MAVVIGVYRSSNRLEKAAGLVFLARLECHGSVRATLQGVTIKSGSPDAGKYLFADGTLVVDNENADQLHFRNRRITDYAYFRCGHQPICERRSSRAVQCVLPDGASVGSNVTAAAPENLDGCGWNNRPA
jgi:hypothetical protein